MMKDKKRKRRQVNKPRMVSKQTWQLEKKLRHRTKSGKGWEMEHKNIKISRKRNKPRTEKNLRKKMKRMSHFTYIYEFSQQK